MKVVHLTSVHPRFDTRIFFKECRSLAAHGYEVALVVADGLGDIERDGIRIVDVGPSPNRIHRMLHTTRRACRQAAELDADIVHIHDPELLFGALALKRQGARVIYDAHEDLPRQILAKPYLASALRSPLAAIASTVEYEVSHRIDSVIAATPHIRDRFRVQGVQSVDVCNFPLLNELHINDETWETKRNEVCYVGGISAVRGASEMVSACEVLHSDARINLVGRFSEPELEHKLRVRPGWSRINAYGYLDRPEVRCVMARSIAGLVPLHPAPNYLNALPVKMFEYMAAGIPVIASNIDLWREIVESNDCGICVDPFAPDQLASAIDWLTTNRQEAQRLGENGRRAVVERYNWEAEEHKLIAEYEHVVALG